MWFDRYKKVEVNVEKVQVYIYLCKSFENVLLVPKVH